MQSWYRLHRNRQGRWRTGHRRRHRDQYPSLSQGFRSSDMNDNSGVCKKFAIRQKARLENDNVCKTLAMKQKARSGQYKYTWDSFSMENFFSSKRCVNLSQYNDSSKLSMLSRLSSRALSQIILLQQKGLRKGHSDDSRSSGVLKWSERRNSIWRSKA